MLKRKKLQFMVLLLLTAVLLMSFASLAVAVASGGPAVISMQLGSPNMTINGQTRPIDEAGTTPTTVNGRTLLPLRAIAESLGLTVEWDAATQTITLRSGAADGAADAEQSSNESGAKVLVAYFSATNNTETVAGLIATELNADLYEITPAIPYTSADLDYGNANSRTSQEMNDPAARPAISGSLENMAEYDVVFIGYPIWWGQAPKIISTFLEAYDFSGKTIVPFCTSSSSGIGSSATNLQDLTAEATWLAGQRFAGSASQAEVANWLNSLNLPAVGARQ